MVKFHTAHPLARLGLCLSGWGCTLLLIMTSSKLSFAVTGLLSLILLGVLCYKTKFIEEIFQETHWGLCALAGILALCEVYRAKSTFFSTCGSWMGKLFSHLHLPTGLIRLIPWLLALVALPMMFGYLLWFVRFLWKHAKSFWHTSDFTERMFLLSAGIVFTILIVFTYLCTQAFYGAHLNGAWYNFDLIYSADSGYLVNTDVFRNSGADQTICVSPCSASLPCPLRSLHGWCPRCCFSFPTPISRCSRSCPYSCI